ncbi:hypothetical protein OH76DRAFT_359093 [Lentinus brumalis]|uniref:Uncharacterized protein n=1 Tax=Lentinus brumalis TaxID=2498619 RepID=A0A371CJB9_9APHY|nr:hypothetical protein OH76DRAFT_359093 [Polyporus brumalis]
MPYRLKSSISPQQLSDLAVFRAPFPRTGVAEPSRYFNVCLLIRRTQGIPGLDLQGPSTIHSIAYTLPSRSPAPGNIVAAHDAWWQYSPSFFGSGQHGDSRLANPTSDDPPNPQFHISNSRLRTSSYLPDDIHEPTACRARRRRHSYLLRRHEHADPPSLCSADISASGALSFLRATRVGLRSPS